MLDRSDLNCLKERIILEMDDNLIHLSSYSNKLVIRSVVKGTNERGFGDKLSDYQQGKAENRIDRLNPLLDMLDPTVARGQMSVGRAMSIYGECIKIGGIQE